MDAVIDDDLGIERCREDRDGLMVAVPPRAAAGEREKPQEECNAFQSNLSGLAGHGDFSSLDTYPARHFFTDERVLLEDSEILQEGLQGASRLDLHGLIHFA